MTWPTGYFLTSCRSVKVALSFFETRLGIFPTARKTFRPATISSRGLQRDHVRGRLAAHDCGDVTRPGFERGFFLDVIGVALIDADDTGARAGDVAEHSLDHLQADAEPLQSSCRRA